jgi:hypothetical protein
MNSEESSPENASTSIVAVATTNAVATPADLEAIPTVVAELPSPEAVDLEGSSSSIPLAVATAIRNETNQNPESLSIEPQDQDTSWKWKYRREDRPLVFLFCILVLMAVAVTLHEVLPGEGSENEDPDSTFSFYVYPKLELAESIPCPRTSASNHSCYWKQIGSDLQGPTAGDFFGATLRLGGTAEGSRFSVTAPLYGYSQGLTQVYDVITHEDKKNTNTTYPFQQVGTNVVGKYEDDSMQGIMADDGYHLTMSSVDATFLGQPHVGHFGSLQISPESKRFELYGNEMYGESSRDDFGAAVVNRDGTIVAISDVQYDKETVQDNITNAGIVMLFRYNIISNKWNQLGQKLEGSSTDEYWGRKMALSGDGYTVIIGSRNYDSNKGKVQAYVYNSTEKEWLMLGRPIIGSEIGQECGREIELSADGKILAVTSSYSASNSTEAHKTGFIQVFSYNEDANEWQQMGNSISSDQPFQSDFGYQIRSSDDVMRLAISEAKYSPTDELTSAGRVRVYDYLREEQVWLLIGDISGKRSCDFVGAGFDLSPDGSRLIGEIQPCVIPFSNQFPNDSIFN